MRDVDAAVDHAGERGQVRGAVVGGARVVGEHHRRRFVVRRLLEQVGLHEQHEVEQDDRLERRARQARAERADPVDVLEHLDAEGLERVLLPAVGATEPPARIGGLERTWLRARASDPHAPDAGVGRRRAQVRLVQVHVDVERSLTRIRGLREEPRVHLLHGARDPDPAHEVESRHGIHARGRQRHLERVVRMEAQDAAAQRRESRRALRRDRLGEHHEGVGGRSGASRDRGAQGRGPQGGVDALAGRSMEPAAREAQEEGIPARLAHDLVAALPGASDALVGQRNPASLGRTGHERKRAAVDDLLAGGQGGALGRGRAFLTGGRGGQRKRAGDEAEGDGTQHGGSPRDGRSMSGRGMGRGPSAHGHGSRRRSPARSATDLGESRSGAWPLRAALRCSARAPIMSW